MIIMAEYTEWKRFFQELTPEELFVAGTLWTRDQDIAKMIVEKSLDASPIDFVFDDYIDLMGYLVERVVNDDESYQVRKWSEEGYQEEHTTLLHAENIVGYFLRFHATHKVTQDLNPEKRRSILTSIPADGEISLKDPWMHVQSTMMRDIVHYRKKARGLPTDYNPLLDLDELAKIGQYEGVPLNVLQRMDSESSDAMERVNISLGGGNDRNSIVRVVYILGRELPERFSSGDEVIREPNLIISRDKSFVPHEVVVDSSTSPLAPRDYALISLRQNMKGMGSTPFNSLRYKDDLAELLGNQ